MLLVVLRLPLVFSFRSWPCSVLFMSLGWFISVCDVSGKGTTPHLYFFLFNWFISLNLFAAAGLGLLLPFCASAAAAAVFSGVFFCPANG